MLNFGNNTALSSCNNTFPSWGRKILNTCILQVSFLLVNLIKPHLLHSHLCRLIFSMHAVCSFHSYKLIFKHSGFSSSSAAEAFCELSYYEAAPAEPLKLRLLKTLSLLG